VIIEETYKNKLLEMLVAIDGVCKKNNIQYWLDGCTLLGAYRHGGFIPWDDDVDIGVMRADFPKIKKALTLELPNQFFLQTDDSELNYKHAFIKVRDTQTTSSAKLDSTYDQRGLFIDIFPFDFVPKSHALRVLHYIIAKMRLFLVVYEKQSVIDFSDARRAKKELASDANHVSSSAAVISGDGGEVTGGEVTGGEVMRGEVTGGEVTGAINNSITNTISHTKSSAQNDVQSDKGFNKKSNNFSTHVFYLLLNWVPKRFWSWLLYATRKTVINKKHIGDGYCFPTFFFKSIREYDVYFPLTDIQFEGKTFSAPHNVPRYLTSLYGADYMTPRQDLHTQHMESLQNVDDSKA
jgi:phosphorylcholine metabolism protein LicD